MRWLFRRPARSIHTAAEAPPVQRELRRFFEVVAEQRDRRESEGRHLFQELDRRRAQAPAVEPVRAAASIEASTVAPTPAPVASRESIVAPMAVPEASGRRRPRLPRLVVPAFPSVLRSRRVLVSVPILAVALATVTAGVAYWTTGGSGSASASAGTLDAASISVPGASTGSVVVTWDTQAAMTPSSQNSSVTYTVERKLGAGSFVAIGTVPCSGSLPRPTTSCTDTVGVSGTYTYRVVAHFSTSWTATSNEAAVVVNVDTTPPEVDSITIDDASPTSASEVHWTVTFTEDVTGVDATDFALVGSGSGGGALITDVTGSGDTYTVTADTGDDGVLGLNLVDNDSIEDLANNPLGPGDGSFTGETYTVDRTAPSVSTITRDGANPTNAGTVSWTVTFNEDVNNVDTSDFTLTTSGLTGTPAVGSVTPIDAQTYTVTASTGTSTPSGSGTIRLDVVDDDSIEDGVGNPLGGAGAGNGDFTTGETYMIDKTQPTVTIALQAGSDTGTSNSDNITNAVSLVFNVNFSESVSGLAAGDFTNAGTATGCSVGAPTGGPSSYTVTLTSCSAGTVTLRLAASGVTDTAGNANVQTDGPTVTRDTTAPVATIDLQAGSDSGTSNTDNLTNAASLVFDVTFSESVSGLAVGDFSIVAGGTATGCVVGAPAGSGSAYTVTLTSCSAGTVTLRLAASGVTDTAGNANAQTDSATITIDRTAPTITAVSDTGGTTDGLMQLSDTLMITFSEAVAGVSTTANALTVTEERSASGNHRLNIPGVTNGALGLGAANYVTGPGTKSFSSTGTASFNVALTILTVTVTSAPSGNGTPALAGGPGTFVYDPATGITDLAGNLVSNTFSVSSFRLF